MIKKTCVISMIASAAYGVAGEQKQPSDFGGDVEFLKKHTDVVVLDAPDSDAKIAVIPSMQGRIMTSTAQGDSGTSYGWINYDLTAKNERQPHINVFGGEDRFWIGPEGGKFSVFFKKGDSQTFENWHTPTPIDWGGWDVVEQDKNSILFAKDFTLTNTAGTQLDLGVKRRVSVFGKPETEKHLGVKLGDQIKYVGYESDNIVTNQGKSAWTKETGMPSVWILGMLKHSPKTVVAIPFKKGEEVKFGPVVKDDYFGKVPADRLKVDADKGVIYFKGDGQKRCKIGVPPKRSTDICGSYSPESGTLSIVQFTFPENAKDYVNSMWTDDPKVDPFAGDVINSYNDGPNDKGEIFGPFYELESSSPALALDKEESGRHVHRTYHFQGDKTQLNELSVKLLGVGLSDIQSAFTDTSIVISPDGELIMAAWEWKLDTRDVAAAPTAMKNLFIDNM